jgi:hypothetical protein
LEAKLCFAKKPGISISYVEVARQILAFRGVPKQELGDERK